MFRSLPGLVLAFLGLALTAAEGPPGIDGYDVVWDSPSADARGSMPLGNGDISLNAWIEADGDLQLYIGKTDAWDDNGRLLKLGRVRLALDPNPFRKGGTFRQVLHLRGGEMVVTAAPLDGRDAPVEIRLWVDANHPLVQVEVTAAKPVAAHMAIELWRTEATTLPSIECSDIFTRCPKPPDTVVEPDTVLAGISDGIGWYHRNSKSVGPELTMRFQDLMEAPWKEPLLHRVFGALIRAEGAQRSDDRHLTGPAALHHRFDIHVLTRHPATAKEWLTDLRATIQRTEAVDAEARRREHLAWWESFWDRSRISIRDRSDPVPSGSTGNTPGHDVALGYNLQRFITACAGRGAYPIKYNGSIFIMPWPGKPGDADYRKWGPGYWWQNSRLPYLASCAAGDTDLMEPLFHMYGGEVLDVCRYRTKRYFAMDGAYFPECMYPWGAVFMESYGWDKPAAERQDKLQTSGWHKWEWVCGPELVFMMQDRYEHTLDDAFLAQRLLPTARAVLGFFANFYKTDEHGRLVMHPAQACETWWDCTDPMPELAGLHAVIARLLALPEGKLPAEDRRWLEVLRAKLPDLPTREEKGVRMLAPAGRFANKRNCENPELYAVFPFRLVSFEKPNAQLGVEALKHRLDRGTAGWRQDDIFMAYLGLAREAQAGVVARTRQKSGCRFPAFWGPNYDWTPDQDHGGVLMKTVQAMLMQTEGKRIFLLPAWPREWDVDFKLHAPYRTVVEGSVREGKLVTLTVTPRSRRQDVQVMDAQ